ncbi:GNAT family N-acetyltransferase [Winogradskyella algicola]|uniref:GNAT family N-acetyltransferase n=1 Tax=Winogradskyella algicola TaxID=2575815 RepID=UPI001109E663|nr:GNAT family N-acetyltransferase [Winogradskyella algicola]
MEVLINTNLDTINWKDISELFQLVNWGTRDPKDIEKAFKKSAVTCFIKDKDVIVGFGRTVDDGQYYALLVDVVVHPKYQSKGIGTQIVNALKNRLKGYNFITLTAAPNKEGFYEKIGWKKQTSAYIFPKDDKQFKEHCES